MAGHRSNRPQPPWRRWLWSRAAIVAADIRRPLLESEVIACNSAEFYLAPGHPWASIRCLVCAEPPGGRAMVCSVIMGAAVAQDRYYRAGAAGYLIHADHGKPDPLELWQLAHYLETPGCPCHTRSAGERMSYPYHQL